MKNFEQRLAKAITDAFPVQPVPEIIMNPEEIKPDDFYVDILGAFNQKTWREISLETWRGTGLHVWTIGSYMLPSSFRYYVPSLLYDGLKSSDLELALEAIMPPNQRRIPKGMWWNNYYDGFSKAQKEVIGNVIDHGIRNFPEGSWTNVLAAIAAETKLYPRLVLGS